MGLSYVQLKIRNPKRPTIESLTVSALADTGALHLCIPQHLAIQLELEELQKREVTTADGKKHLCPYVGPVELSFQNRACYVGALVLGDEVLLGAVPMEDMDLIIHPSLQTVMANPENPNIPSAKVKNLGSHFSI